MKVEDVMREADNLLRLGHEERMKFCVFTYDPKFLGAYGKAKNKKLTYMT